MKVITEKENNVVKIILPDSTNVTINKDNITFDDENGTNIYTCLDSTNTTLYENITVPSGKAIQKHTFDGTSWADNPNYTAPLY
tara:strand:- start:81 stop:332 length:252 start_codon:yes stop_codon:yes gene_type:complete